MNERLARIEEQLAAVREQLEASRSSESLVEEGEDVASGPRPAEMTIAPGSGLARRQRDPERRPQ